MSTTVTIADDLPRLARPECTQLAITEMGWIVELLRSLEDADWVRPTDCPLWDVQALAGHVLGMLQTFSSLPRFARDMSGATSAASIDNVLFIDALTDRQVRRNAGLGRQALTNELARLGPVQARWRARRGLMRRIPIKNPMPDGSVETWPLGYLVDVILIRDPWMHRIDLSRAVSRPLTLTPEHDGRIVADVVVEWAQRHGQPFTLTLTGPAGGRWRSGSAGADLQLDAIDFCRTLAGRAPGEGLLDIFACRSEARMRPLAYDSAPATSAQSISDPSTRWTQGSRTVFNYVQDHVVAGGDPVPQPGQCSRCSGSRRRRHGASDLGPGHQIWLADPCPGHRNGSPKPSVWC